VIWVYEYIENKDEAKRQEQRLTKDETLIL